MIDGILEIKHRVKQKCVLKTVFLNTCIKKAATMMKENLLDAGLGWCREDSETTERTLSGESDFRSSNYTGWAWQGTLQSGANEQSNVESKLDPENLQGCVWTLGWARRRKATKDLMS